MATSGTTTFTLTAGDVVERAFSKIGVKAAEQALQSFEMKDGLEVLNLVLKSMQAEGLHLWSREEGVLFLDVGKTDYLVGPTGDEATTLDDFIGTTTTSDEAALATVIEVSDTTGMLANDTAGIELDDKTRHWTTIVSVDSSTQITINTGIPSVAASGSTVFTFTNLIDRPLKITSFRRKTFGVDNEIIVNQWSRDEYFNQTNKNSQGTVVDAYYSALLGNGRIYVWQTASSVNDFVRFSFQSSIEDVGDQTKTLDIPVEWLDAIIYGVAARLVDDYDTPTVKGDRIILKAQGMLDDVLGWDQEYESINLQPDFN